MVWTPRIISVSSDFVRSSGNTACRRGRDPISISLPSSTMEPEVGSRLPRPVALSNRLPPGNGAPGCRLAARSNPLKVAGPSRLPSWPAGQVDHLIPGGRWEGVLERDVAVVLRAGDCELRTARGDRLDRFAARSHNGRLAVHAVIACRRWRVPSRNHHPTLIRQQLRFDIAYGHPTDARPLVDQPIVLAVREKVPRHWLRHGHLEPRTDRCHKRRAVARGTRFVADWVACLPAHILARQPVALNVHRIELLGKNRTRPRNRQALALLDRWWLNLHIGRRDDRFVIHPRALIAVREIISRHIQTVVAHVRVIDEAIPPVPIERVPVMATIEVGEVMDERVPPPDEVIRLRMSLVGFGNGTDEFVRLFRLFHRARKPRGRFWLRFGMGWLDGLFVFFVNPGDFHRLFWLRRMAGLFLRWTSRTMRRWLARHALRLGR